jgi:site-specific DNA-methyltransferase (adenine-specific)
VTDPPYPTLERHRAVGTTTRMKSHDQWEYLSHEEILGVLGFLADRVVPGGYVLAVMDAWTWMLLGRLDGIDDRDIKRSARAPRGTLTGLWWRHPWTWVKTTLDGEKVYGGTGYHGRRATEMIAIFQKPGSARQGIKDKIKYDLDVHFAPRIKSTKAYPTQKPVALGEKLLSTFALEGDLVIDPFAGSGRWLVDPAARQQLELELWDLRPETEKMQSSGDWA